jgi:Zn-finger nucleic acid-binding protein
MQCPVCKTVNLTMAERSGIEIDYCPQCRGVWLDRGELDKIIERAAPGAAMPAAVQPPPQQPAYAPQQPGHAQQQGYPHQQPSYGYHKKKKREGFLGELFDFD